MLNAPGIDGCTLARQMATERDIQSVTEVRCYLGDGERTAER